MPRPRAPLLSFLPDEDLPRILDQAHRVLAEVGVEVEPGEARELLLAAGAKAARADRRLLLPPELVDEALRSVPSTISFFDREGEPAFELGAGGGPRFCPGSVAIRVLDWGAEEMRPSTLADCERFARITEALDAYDFQSTCVVPTDVAIHAGDSSRLAKALEHCRKPIVTGTFHVDSFEVMRGMLSCVRGSEEELAAKPLAIFDCCPTSPLAWSELTSAALIGCARSGIPAELISVPMTGATAPVTLWGAIVQHVAENLSGVVIHQLAAPEAPIVWGGCASGFDMRRGTAPIAAIESVMMNAAAARLGRHLGLPTHGFFALSDSKTLDYQAGMESGSGAMIAALSGVDVIAGPGILELVACQSLEKLVLDHEACRAALRAVRGIGPERGEDSVAIIAQGVEAGHFLNLDHTLRSFRDELHFPGPSIDRRAESSWLAAGGCSAAEVAHAEVIGILAAEGAPSLPEKVLRELSRAHPG